LIDQRFRLTFFFAKTSALFQKMQEGLYHWKRYPEEFREVKQRNAFGTLVTSGR
jgi:hypothetical protein